MKKAFLILSLIALLIGGVFFADQVLAIFKGMTVLEAMKFIVTFVLHVVVVTICMYTLYTLPEIAMPIIKFLKSFFRGLRMKRRGARRGVSTASGRAPLSAQRGGKLTTDQILRAYAMQQLLPKQRRGEPAAQPQDDIRIDF